MIENKKVCSELQHIGEVYLSWLLARRETAACFEVFKQWEDEDDLSVPTKQDWSQGKWAYFREYQSKITREKQLLEILFEQQDLVLASLAIEGFSVEEHQQSISEHKHNP